MICRSNERTPPHHRWDDLPNPALRTATVGTGKVADDEAVLGKLPARARDRPAGLYTGCLEEGAMALTITTDPAPITLDADGVARVAGTRVRLDTVVNAYKLGATPEEIALDYDSIRLADVYGAIAYYLRHTAEVDEYLRVRQAEAEQLRRLNEARIDRQAIRERLEARQARLHAS
jgi:uncharacterized protein (DUF433 family)